MNKLVQLGLVGASTLAAALAPLAGASADEPNSSTTAQAIAALPNGMQIAPELMSAIRTAKKGARIKLGARMAPAGSKSEAGAFTKNSAVYGWNYFHVS